MEHRRERRGHRQGLRRQGLWKWGGGGSGAGGQGGGAGVTGRSSGGGGSRSVRRGRGDRTSDGGKAAAQAGELGHNEQSKQETTGTTVGKVAPAIAPGCGYATPTHTPPATGDVLTEHAR